MDEVLREEVPQRLLSAARGKGLSVIDLVAERARRIGVATLPRHWDDRHWWLRGAVAASILCLLIGAGGGYVVAHNPTDGGTTPPQSTAYNWLDNIAGYHRLLINAGVNEEGLVDVPPNGDQGRKNIQKLPAGFRLPNLKPLGLAFEGARYLIVDGGPATQLFYTSKDKKLGSITIVIGPSAKPDFPIAVERRDDMNFIYWRHAGHAYALVGTADVAYLRNLAKEVSFQLKAAT
jgi:anti-sigma factor RsiW